MNRRDIASLAFKLAGLYALIQVLAQIQIAAYVFRGPPSGTNIAALLVGTVASFGSLAAFGCVLIAASRRLAMWMFPEEATKETPRIRVLTLQAAAFSVVGVLLAASAVPALVGVGVELLDAPGRIALRSVAVIAMRSVAELVVGVGLFLGGHGLARLWARLRYAGLRREMGLCVRCGYDLTGNESGVCPECGTPVGGTDDADGTEPPRAAPA